MSKQELSVVESKELSPVEKAEQVGSVVAVQLNYNMIVFETRLEDIVKLEEQYKDLKGDTAEGYDEVAKAIADCRTRRTTVDKQKKVYKRPAIDWNAEAERRAKEVIDKLQKIEDALKQEKDRIDAIKAEEKRAREEARLRTLKNQMDNLNKIRLIAVDLHGLNMDELKAEMEAINLFDIGRVDLGEYLEDAKVELANARIRVESAIAHEKQRLEVEAEKERLRKDREDQAAREREAEALRKAEDAERQRKEAEAEKARQEEAAEKQRQLDAANARLAEMEAEQNRRDEEAEKAGVAEQEAIRTPDPVMITDSEQSPDPETDIVAGPPGDEGTTQALGHIVGAIDGEIKRRQQVAHDQKDSSRRDNSSGGFGYYSPDRGRPTPIVELARQQAADKVKLSKFIGQLAAVSFGAPALENEEAQKALDRVITAIDNMVVFLTETKNRVL